MASTAAVVFLRVLVASLPNRQASDLPSVPRLTSLCADGSGCWRGRYELLAFRKFFALRVRTTPHPYLTPTIAQRTSASGLNAALLCCQAPDVKIQFISLDLQPTWRTYVEAL